MALTDEQKSKLEKLLSMEDLEKRQEEAKMFEDSVFDTPEDKVIRQMNPEALVTGMGMGTVGKVGKSGFSGLKKLMQSAPEEASELGATIERIRKNSPEQAEFISKQIDENTAVRDLLSNKPKLVEELPIEKMKREAIERGVEAEPTVKYTPLKEDLGYGHFGRLRDYMGKEWTPPTTKAKEVAKELENVINLPEAAPEVSPLLSSRAGELKATHPEMIRLKNTFEQIFKEEGPNSPKGMKLWRIWNDKLKQ